MIDYLSGTWHSRNHGDALGELGDTERLVSVLGGGGLFIAGLTGRSSASRLLLIAGGYFVYRGASGHCPITAQLALRAPREGWAASKQQGVEVERAVTINKPAAELYSFWRELENLPNVMGHLESVTRIDDKRSSWVAKAPLGQTVAWEAEIAGEKENELISWRSLPGADVPNAGSVRFRAAPGGRGTEVHVSLKYDPPAGVIGATFAKLFGEEPKLQLIGDLNRFKQLMETGEIATTKGQPSGRGRESL